MRLNVPASVMEIKEHPLPKMHSTEIVRFSKPPSPVLNVMAEVVAEKVDGNEHFLHLTDKGLDVSNTVMADFLLS